ncbi:MAG: Mini-ribonuclease 3 [Clostridiales bacterium]|nr:Mini-ribonuclease 3 [Clostridiales bacterium]
MSFPIPPLTREQARLLSPLQLAFVGDAVHALMVRAGTALKNLNVHDMHLQATGKVNAVSQAKAMQAVFPLLTEEEQQIALRGRNAHAHHGAPKAATAQQYAWATGLEALLGYLYLTEQTDRLMELSPYLETEEK